MWVDAFRREGAGLGTRLGIKDKIQQSQVLSRWRLLAHTTSVIVLQLSESEVQRVIWTKGKRHPQIPLPEYGETEAQQEERLQRWCLGVIGVGTPDSFLSFPHTSVPGPKAVVQFPPSLISAAGHLSKTINLPTYPPPGWKEKVNLLWWFLHYERLLLEEKNEIRKGGGCVWLQTIVFFKQRRLLLPPLWKSVYALNTAFQKQKVCFLSHDTIHHAPDTLSGKHKGERVKMKVTHSPTCRTRLLTLGWRVLSPLRCTVFNPWSNVIMSVYEKTINSQCRLLGELPSL